MKNKKKSYLKALNPEDTRAIHEAALRIMAETGILIHDPATRTLLKHSGCKETAQGRLLLETNMVQEALSTAPASVKLYTQNGQVAVDTDDESPCLTPGSNCMITLDHRTGTHRPTLLQDVSNAARVCDHMDNVGMVSSLGWPSDIPPEEVPVKTVKLMLTQSKKPIAFIGHDESQTQKIWGYLSEVAGGWDALSQRPIAVDLIGPDSPLSIGADTCRRIRFAAQKAVPIICYSGLIPGVTGPMTLAGALAQSAAEGLAGLIIHQLENPGAPFITGSPILPMDMKTSNLGYGTPEYALAGLASVDYYSELSLPNWIGAGCSDSHSIDAQAVAEASLSINTAVMSRAGFIHNLGFLSSGKTGSLEMLVLGSNLARMADRVYNGITINPDTLGVNLIDEILSDQKTFLSHPHTVKHVRNETTQLRLFDRIGLDPWLAGSQKDIIEKIRDRIEDILGH